MHIKANAPAGCRIGGIIRPIREREMFTKWFLPVVGIASVTTMPAWAQAQAPADPSLYYGPHMMWWGNGWYGLIFGPLFMLLLVAAVITAIVLITRSGTGARQPPQPTSPAPLDILKERFARGEINDEEYERKRRMLMQQ